MLQVLLKHPISGLKWKKEKIWIEKPPTNFYDFELSQKLPLANLGLSLSGDIQYTGTFSKITVTFVLGEETVDLPLPNESDVTEK